MIVSDKIFPAHIRSLGNADPLIQTAAEHCRKTAEYAGQALHPAGFCQAGYLAGLLHDCGKFKQEFSDYLMDSFQGKPVAKGSVNHTFAGFRMLMEHFHGKTEDHFTPVTCELLAYAVGAHHGQFDCVDQNGGSGFAYRMKKENISYSESRDNFLKYCADWPELKARFRAAHEELLPVYQKLMAYPDDAAGNGQLMFSIGLLARLLLSAVIEGDRRDTAEFMCGCRDVIPEKQSVDFWRKYLERVEKKLEAFPQKTEIQRTRRIFSDACRQAADRPAGIYRLNLPTGGGKTLSSLRYALAHAAGWGKQRIVFVTPLLTILEQNARVIRDFIGDDSIILEHHSNVVESAESAEALDLRELAAESWEAPVILTTLVQLLNTMFLGKTTSVRRFSALCNAVVVIDEVQTVPNRMLSLFNTAVNFLSEFCGTTFLLCSATQPCFDKAEHPLFFAQNADLVPYQESLWRPFRRTIIQDGGGMCLQEIPELVRERIRTTESLLVICNKKAQAEFLYQSLASENAEVFHLSSSMCMAHRRDILKEMEASLEAGKKTGRKTICVSTQVMEAGVDISFGTVIRLTAGMDSVVQAAGRCNRNGENPQPAPVLVISCMDENLGKLREIRTGKQVTTALLNQFRRNPEKLGKDLASVQAIQWYYEELFRELKTTGGYQQFFIKGHGTLFELLSSNYMEADNQIAQDYTLCQAFGTAGALFHVLDQETTDVAVPYGGGAQLISELASHDFSPDSLKSWAQKAKPYTVSLYEYQKTQLQNGLVNLHGVWVLRPEYYDSGTGLITKSEAAFLEV